MVGNKAAVIKRRVNCTNTSRVGCAFFINLYGNHKFLKEDIPRIPSFSNQNEE